MSCSCFELVVFSLSLEEAEQPNLLSGLKSVPWVENEVNDVRVDVYGFQRSWRSAQVLTLTKYQERVTRD